MDTNSEIRLTELLEVYRSEDVLRDVVAMCGKEAEDRLVNKYIDKLFIVSGDVYSTMVCDNDIYELLEFVSEGCKFFDDVVKELFDDLLEDSDYAGYDSVTAFDAYRNS